MSNAPSLVTGRTERQAVVQWLVSVSAEHKRQGKGFKRDGQEAKALECQIHSEACDHIALAVERGQHVLYWRDESKGDDAEPATLGACQAALLADLVTLQGLRADVGEVVEQLDRVALGLERLRSDLRTALAVETPTL